MFNTLNNLIAEFDVNPTLNSERDAVLQPLVEALKNLLSNDSILNLNFICTHNSRRSQLAQVWAQTIARHFGFNQINCYSGGTEVTEVHQTIIHTLKSQGFSVSKLGESVNAVHVIKADYNSVPTILYSKLYDSPFNPKDGFMAIMTCSQAESNCPIVTGATKRLTVTYEDPKASDGTDSELQRYNETSLIIGREMFYVFRQLKAFMS